MNELSGRTASEKKLVLAWQERIGVRQDNYIGPASVVSTLVWLGVEGCWPATLKIYGCPVIVCREILPIAAKSDRLSAYSNSLSGSFAYNDGSGPASILYADGKAERSVACHYFDGKYPESVIFRRIDGSFGIARLRTLNDLIGYPSGIRWAVGGMGLLDNYYPGAEGFKGAFSDVLRRTNHTVLGVKDGMVYLVYMANMTAGEVQAKAKVFAFDHAIMLDGGHIAAINGAESFARINRAQAQQYILQAR